MGDPLNLTKELLAQRVERVGVEAGVLALLELKRNP